MRKCIVCNKSIDDRKATATTCSTGCRTEMYRRKNGIGKPEFLSITKPMNATNEQRKALSKEDKQKVRLLKVELDNHRITYDGLILDYKRIHKLLRDYEFRGYLPNEYLIDMRDFKKPVEAPAPEFKELLIFTSKFIEINKEDLKKRFTSKKWVIDEEKTENEYQKIKEEIDSKNNKFLSKKPFFAVNDTNIQNTVLYQKLISGTSKLKEAKKIPYPPKTKYEKMTEVLNEEKYNEELKKLEEQNKKLQDEKNFIDKENKKIVLHNKHLQEQYELDNKDYFYWISYKEKHSFDNGTCAGILQLQHKELDLKKSIDYSRNIIDNLEEELKNIYKSLEIEQEPEETDPMPKEVNYQKKESKITTGADIARMKFKTYKFSEEWESLLGSPSQPFSAMVFGDAKAGKSSFCLSLAQYLTLFGDVVYFTCEEGLNETIRRKIEVTEAYDVIINKSDTIESITDALHRDRYHFCFIDSVSHARMNVEDFQELKKQFPKTSFIAILQTNKNNQFKGEKEWLHDADTILELTKTGTHSTKIECKGRFGTGEKVVKY